MAFWKLTYSEKYKRAGVHNFGCNFRCTGCSYKAIGVARPERFPSLEEFKKALSGLRQLERVHFLGGEPTSTADLPELLQFCKKELGVWTCLGHTNGSHLCLENLDEANVTIKAFDNDRHYEYTGYPGAAILDNFRRAFERGIRLRASTVLIPGLVDGDEVEKIAAFVAGFSEDLPFRITGYVPVPGAPWRRPTDAEVDDAVMRAGRHLRNVTWSHLKPEDLQHPESRSDHYVVERIL